MLALTVMTPVAQSYHQLISNRGYLASKEFYSNEIKHSGQRPAHFEIQEYLDGWIAHAHQGVLELTQS